MNARFYAPGAATPGSTFDLPDEEGQHLTRVLRLGEGAAIRVFDGRGQEFSALVTTASHRGVRVTLGERVTPAAEPRVRVTLVQAVLKGDSMDAVVRDSIMVGVAAIQPVISDRTEVSLAALTRGARLARWERIAIASVKQCGRAVLPTIHAPLTLQAWLDSPHTVPADAPLRLVCMEPGAEVSCVPVSALAGSPPADAQLLVGPEGGWSHREVPVVTTRCVSISLGGRTLRADTAPTVALAALFTRWGEL